MINFKIISIVMIKNKLVFAINILVLFIVTVGLSYSRDNKVEPEILKLKAPEKFRAKFETSKGDFEVTAERKYSPLAVDRFYQLVKSNYFSDVIFYRVMKNFVAQFGTVDNNLDSAWSKYVIVDEPVLKSNETATIAFARAGKDTRGTTLFINLKSNFKLDTVSYGETLGFPPFGHVSLGMDVLYKLFDGYGDEPRLKLDSVAGDATGFIKKNYPNLDYIKKAYIIEK